MRASTVGGPHRYLNCGGTCAECMAQAGDVDCLTSLRDSEDSGDRIAAARITRNQQGDS